MEFWKSFMDSCAMKESIFSNDNEWEELKNKRNLFSRLLKDICIHLKCSEIELDEEIEREEQLYDEPTRLLAQKLAERNGGKDDILDCSFDYEKGEFPSIVSNAVYLTNDMQTRYLIEDKGVLVVSLDELLNSRYCLREPIPISKGKIYDWSTILSPARHICNSLIIIDLYVLKYLEKNLYPILDALVPECLEEVFQLAIVTSDRVGKQLEQCYDEIEKHLQSCGKKTRICLTIVRSDNSQLHDRWIISNNLYIECSGGFDLLNTKGKSTKETTIWYSFPRFADPRDYNTFFNVIDAVKRIAKNNVVYPNTDISLTYRIFE